MNRSKQLLGDVLEILREVRHKLHGDADYVRHLDAAIRELEAAYEKDQEWGLLPQEMIHILGRILEKIPEIANAIEKLTGKQ